MSLKRAPLPGGHVAYVDHGDGEPLVLLHGGGVDHRMWDDQLTAFPARRVLALDARGHGASSTPTTAFRSCDDVVAVLDHAGVDRAVLAGVSMGGATATEVALEYPERTSALVVSGASVSDPDFRDPWVQEVFRAMQQAQEAGDAEGWIAAFLAFVSGPHRGGDDVDSRVLARVDRMVRDTLAAHVRVDPGSSVPAAPVRPTPVADATARLGNIDVPVLAVIGALDADDHQRFSHELAASVQDGRAVTISHTAHYPNMER